MICFIAGEIFTKLCHSSIITPIQKSQCTQAHLQSQALAKELCNLTLIFCDKGFTEFQSVKTNKVKCWEVGDEFYPKLMSPWLSPLASFCMVELDYFYTSQLLQGLLVSRQCCYLPLLSKHFSHETCINYPQYTIFPNYFTVST